MFQVLRMSASAGLISLPRLAVLDRALPHSPGLLLDPSQTVILTAAITESKMSLAEGITV